MVAIGAITNIASALLLNPEIRDRIVIVWLGGHAFHWHDNREFNMRQDIAAARVVLGCGAAVVLLPCRGVVSSFTTSEPELRKYLLGKNALCDYLYNVTCKTARDESKIACWTRPIWDVAAVAYLLDARYMLERTVSAPIPNTMAIGHLTGAGTLYSMYIISTVTACLRICLSGWARLPRLEGSKPIYFYPGPHGEWTAFSWLKLLGARERVTMSILGYGQGNTLRDVPAGTTWNVGETTSRLP